MRISITQVRSLVRTGARLVTLVAGLLSGVTPVSLAAQPGGCDRHLVQMDRHSSHDTATDEHASHAESLVVTLERWTAPHDLGCTHCPPAQCALTAGCSTVAPSIAAAVPELAVPQLDQYCPGGVDGAPLSVTPQPHTRPPITIL